MDAKTAEALEGSIEKWRRISARKGIDEGPDNCPLCELFYNQGCKGCPVSEETGKQFCEATPYYEFIEIAGEDGTPESYSDQAIAVAFDEMHFLESLREK